jgi:hypothetical protein
MQCYLFGDVVLDNPEFRCRHHCTGSALIAIRLIALAGSLFYFSSFVFFWLWASLMPRFDLDVMLFQRLDVFDIILILIYSLSKKGPTTVNLITSN